MLVQRKVIKGVRLVLFDFDDTLINSDPGKRAAHGAVGKKLKALLTRQNLIVASSRLIRLISELDDEMDEAGMLVTDRWWKDLYARLTGTQMGRREAATLTKVYWHA
jgi:phosphoglycolate phosphatase-like HAD superfamily hydrolase